MDRWRNNLTVLLATAFFVGAAYNYLSFLFNPPLAPTLICSLVLATYLSDHAAHRIRSAFIIMLATAFFWFAGYGLTWIAKWFLAGAVLGAETVTADISRAASGADYGEDIDFVESLRVLEATWLILRDGAPHLLASIAVGLALAFGLLAWGTVSRRLKGADMWDFLVLQSPLLIPIVWTELMRDHSVEHLGFVYRNYLPFTVVPVLKIGRASCRERV